MYICIYVCVYIYIYIYIYDISSLRVNFISAEVILDLPCSLIARVSHPYNKVRNAKVLYVFSLAYFWT